MALVKCHECGNEISTEAKVCPKCGAKNKAHKGAKIIKWGIAAVVIILGFAIYNIYEADLNPNIPTCESSRATKVFKNMLNDSPDAHQFNLRAIDVTDQKDISVSSLPEDRVCEVTFRLSNATMKTYIFTFELKEDGGYFVRGTPK